MAPDSFHQKAKKIAEGFVFPWKYTVEVAISISDDESAYLCKLYPHSNMADEYCFSGQVCATPDEALHEFKTLLDDKQSNLQ
ncbi:hypothetical protein [Runella limosa]|uniref:hypothetical protein n=1 Tax=Runella limosa TaxID=370978 RepID=UPI00042147AB|nr:hypothetical protein [Runella limosa]